MKIKDRLEAYELIKDAEEAGAPEELLTQLRSMIPKDKDMLSKEGRQKAGEEVVAEQRSKLAEADELVRMAAEAGAPEELMSTLQEGRRALADPLDVTEEIRATGGVALEGVSGGLLGDEFRAWALSGITGSDYDYQLEQERRIEADLFEQHPGVAYTTLIATGMLPSGALMKSAGVGKTALSGALRQGGVAGAEGAVYGFMEGEGGLENRIAESLKRPEVSLL